MEEDLMSRIKGPTPFSALMDKLEIAQERELN